MGRLPGIVALVLVTFGAMVVAPTGATAGSPDPSVHDTVARSSALSVNGGAGQMSLVGDAPRMAVLRHVSLANVQAGVSVRVQDLSAKPSGTRVALLARAKGSKSYRLLVRVTRAGTVYAAIDRVKRGKFVRLAHPRVVARALSAGAALRLRFKVRGSAKVALTGSVAVAGAARKLKARDMSTQRLESGGVAVWARSGKPGKRRSPVVWDHLFASPIKPAAKPGSTSASSAGPNSMPTSQPGRNSESGPAAAIHGTPYLSTSSVAWGVYENASDPATKRLDYNIAATPTATWALGTDSSVATVSRVVADAAAKSQVPQLVLYGIPNRDCGGLSSGGTSSDSAYRTWIDRVVSAIGAHRAIVILEPDAISFCNNDSGVRAERTGLLAYAAKRLHDVAPNTATYLHAGSAQLPWSYVVPALIDSGIKYMRGFALNVSSHGATSTEETYGDQLVAKLSAAGVSGKHYVVDTSRNGDGPHDNPGAPYNSCNNQGAALGTRPTTNTAGRYDDAYLWIKSPGLSDGTCHNGDPSAGKWFPELATNLVSHARAHGTIDYWPLP